MSDETQIKDSINTLVSAIEAGDMTFSHVVTQLALALNPESDLDSALVALGQITVAQQYFSRKIVAPREDQQDFNMAIRNPNMDLR